MKQGFWTLKEATNFGVKKYNDKKNSYLLWEKIEGPYYLINEGVLNLLKDLRKSLTTSALYDNMKKYGIDQDKETEVLATLEKMGVIVYTNSPSKNYGNLQFYETKSNIKSQVWFRFFKFICLGLFIFVFVHLFYLFMTKFSLLKGVGRAPTLEDYLFFFLYTLIFTTLHEIAHGVVHYLFTEKLPKPISLKPMGKLFFLPVPKVNLNITYLLDSRAQRIAILGAGLFVDFLVIWFSFVMVNLTGQAPLWVYLTWLSSISFTLNLIPLWNSDGYYILSEVLKIPNLNFYARDALRKFFKKKRTYSTGLILYGAAKLFFEFSFFVVYLVLLYKLSSLAGKVGRQFFFGVFILVFLWKFIKAFLKKLKSKRERRQ